MTKEIFMNDADKNHLLHNYLMCMFKLHNWFVDAECHEKSFSFQQKIYQVS